MTGPYRGLDFKEEEQSVRWDSSSNRYIKVQRWVKAVSESWEVIEDNPDYINAEFVKMDGGEIKRR